MRKLDAADKQVCIYWRDILYNDSHFWKGLVMVINCNELKRVGRTPSPPPFLTGHQSADSATQPQNTTLTSNNNNNNLISITSNSLQNRRKSSSTSNSSSATPPLSQSQQHPLLLDGSDSVRNNLYVSIEQRGFDSVCLNGATDSDIIDFASKVSPSVMRKISSGCLRTSCVTDKGLEIFLASLNQSLKHLELSGKKTWKDHWFWQHWWHERSDVHSLGRPKMRKIFGENDDRSTLKRGASLTSSIIISCLFSLFRYFISRKLVKREESIQEIGLESQTSIVSTFFWRKCSYLLDSSIILQFDLSSDSRFSFRSPLIPLTMDWTTTMVSIVVVKHNYRL